MRYIFLLYITMIFFSDIFCMDKLKQIMSETEKEFFSLYPALPQYQTQKGKKEYLIALSRERNPSFSNQSHEDFANHILSIDQKIKNLKDNIQLESTNKKKKNKSCFRISLLQYDHDFGGDLCTIL